MAAHARGGEFNRCLWAICNPSGPLGQQGGVREAGKAGTRFLDGEVRRRVAIDNRLRRVVPHCKAFAQALDRSTLPRVCHHMWCNGEYRLHVSVIVG